MASQLLHNYLTTSKKITNVFGRWIVLYNHVVKMFPRVDTIRF